MSEEEETLQQSCCPFHGVDRRTCGCTEGGVLRATNLLRLDQRIDGLESELYGLIRNS